MTAWVMTVLQIPPKDKPRAFANVGKGECSVITLAPHCAILLQGGPILHPAGRILLGVLWTGSAPTC